MATRVIYRGRTPGNCGYGIRWLTLGALGSFRHSLLGPSRGLFTDLAIGRPTREKTGMGLLEFPDVAISTNRAIVSEEHSKARVEPDFA